MQQFFAILNDEHGNGDWAHPQSINGQSKQEIFNLLKENVPEESIVSVLTQKEYYAKVSNKQFQQNEKVQQMANMDADNFSNGNDFLNHMIQAATAVGEIQEANIVANNSSSSSLDLMSQNDLSNQHIEQQEQKIIKIEPKAVQSLQCNSIEPPKFFEESGIKFKLENGKLYKKSWHTIDLEAVNTDIEYRIKNKTTGKPINSDKYELQKLEWEIIN